MQQWIDLARYTGLQSHKNEETSIQISDSTNSAALDTSIDENNKQ